MPNMFNALAGAIGVVASFSGLVSQLSGKVNLPQFGKLFGVNKGSEG
jgi:ABC-type Na+ transport system ATPase subunit NatA